jgi:Zn-dependent M28 family amino/carboxypeptidase
VGDARAVRQPDIVELMDGMEANTKLYAPELTIEKAYFSYGSDHVSFQRAGIPAFLVRTHTRAMPATGKGAHTARARPGSQSIEQDNTDYPGYHATTDTVAYLSVSQSIGITRGMAGLLYDVAGAR